MKLSLSVRIVEAPCKSRLNVPFEELVAIARETGRAGGVSPLMGSAEIREHQGADAPRSPADAPRSPADAPRSPLTGYAAVCMRASAGGVGTPIKRLEEMRKCVENAGLRVSMVTADVNVPRNNDQGPESLRTIGPSLDVAEALGCDLIRVCLKKPEDIPLARTAAIEAAKRSIRLAHQCHTSSLFEEVDGILNVLSQIDQPNFGIIYEPANLLLCGQSYGLDTLGKLCPHLMNVYVQNHRLSPTGTDELPTYCRGPVRFDHLDPWEPGGIDFAAVCSALKQIGYAGTLTIHQAQGITTADAARAFADRCGRFFAPLL